MSIRAALSFRKTAALLALIGGLSAALFSGSAWAPFGTGAAQRGLFSISASAVACGGACAQQTLKSTTLPALVLNNKTYRVLIQGFTANNANAKSATIIFCSINPITFTVPAGAFNGWQIETVYVKTGTNVQTIYTRFSADNGTASTAQSTVAGNGACNDGTGILVEAQVAGVAVSDMSVNLLMVEALN